MTEGSKRVSKRDVDRVARFLEELGWLLRSFSDLDLQSIAQVTQLAGLRNVLVHNGVDPSRSESSNSVFLVGTLPALFVDETIFPQNEDIADFALETLHVKIPRWQKKSKYELIGHIVCNASTLGDRELDALVSALNLVLRNDKKARSLLAERQQAGLSWSETIQMINRER